MAIGKSGDGGNRTHVKFPPCLTADGFEVLLDEADRWLLQNPRWTWRLSPYHRGSGGYVVRHTQVDGKHARVFLHRAIVGLPHGDRRRVDHINGDPLDNRRANLRIVTDAENAQNQGSRGGSSRYRGVTWDKSRQKWMATAMLNGRRTTIGRFDTEDEAARAAEAWRARHMPFSRKAAA